MLKGLLFPIFALFFAVGIEYSYAEPLENLSISVLEYDDDILSAVIQLEWNHDEAIGKYSVGCVSCMPNTTENFTSSTIILENITSFPNSSNAMLYILAYDLEDEMVHAKQVILDLDQ